MALAECRVLNLIGNVQNCSTPVLELWLCQVEPSGQELVIHAITVFTSLDFKVEFARLTGIGVDQNLHANKTFTGWADPDLSERVSEMTKKKKVHTFICYI